ncbi:efflux RND transporter periplasmic adaptor subunit [Phormidesmis priestleyi]
MTRLSECSNSPTNIRWISGTLLSLFLLATPFKAFAHGGHGDEFQGGSQAAQAAGSIQVDAETAKRMGLKIEPATRQRLAFGVKATGQIESLPNQQVEVTTPVGGTVLRLLVKPGERVGVGQPVAMMTSPELAELRTTALDRGTEATSAVQQAEADLRLAQKNYAQQQKIAEADIRQAQTELSFSQERYDRDSELAKTGALPRRNALESQTKLAEAKAAFAKAQSRLSVSEAEAQLQRAQSAVEMGQSKVQLSGQTYQTRLRQLGATANEDGTITVVAPISGVVADREATIGESGQDAGKKIMTIVNGSSVQIAANIYEKDLSKIQVGQRVQVKVNGLPNRSFTGRISTIGATVQGESRVIPVKAEIENSDGALKPGMFSELEVLTDRTTVAVLTIPASAIVETNDKKNVVFVQNGTAFQPTEVTLGQRSGESVEIKTGVFDGDMIVTQRANQLYAQSLRGGAKVETDNHAEAPQASTTKAGFQLPWWAMLPLGGAIAGGMFWAGTYWAGRRNRVAPVPVSNSDFNGSPYEAEIHFDHSQSPNGKHPARTVEEQSDPTRPN